VPQPVPAADEEEFNPFLADAKTGAGDGGEDEG
jgi:hypothetical protein